MPMPDALTVGSLFSGIGGFDLGLERAGMRVVWQCEQDPYCQAVLAKHWPGVPCYPDVAQLRGANVEAVDVLCGGFPCQDLSVAGKGAGLSGERSGLWFEYLRCIGELRPSYVIVENVPGIRKYLGTILGGLSEARYDAEWDCIRASDFGAPHRRARFWIVAYPQCGELREQPGGSGRTDGSSAPLVAVDGEAWTVEPDVGRVAHGVPARVDRLRALGNALIPQIAEWIGRQIVDYEGALND